MKNSLEETNLREVLSRFDLPGTLYRFRPIGQGHINDTFLVEINIEGGIEKYTLQRINTQVFPYPELMMANFARITQHIQAKLGLLGEPEKDRKTLRLVFSREGLSYYRSPAGEYWRAYHYIDRCHTVETVCSPEEAFQAGQAFGYFQKLIADLPPSEVYETIPYFHHTGRRFKYFQEKLAVAPAARKKRAAEEILFALERSSLCRLVTAGLESGRLPWRVTHNDTKINNVLFDDDTGRAICVIDLDTTMPGSPLYDFGDLVRSATCMAPEDETDLSRVVMDINMFRAVAAGYLSQTADFLTGAEKELLSQAGLLLTFTIGLRFLTDYLEGDVYFKTTRPEHNLDRARAQFKLLRSMEEQEKEMKREIQAVLSSQV